MQRGEGGGENIPLLFSLRASSPYGRVARSHASTAREMRRKCEGWGKKFLLCPSRLRCSLPRSLDLEMESLLIGYLLLFHPPTLLSTPNPDSFETKYCFFFLHESAIRPLTCERRRISGRQFDLSNRKVTFRVRRPEIRQRKSSAFQGYRSTRNQFFLKKPLSRVVLARPRTHESGQEPMTSLGLLIRFNKSQKCGYRNVRSRVHGV